MEIHMGLEKSKKAVAWNLRILRRSIILMILDIILINFAAVAALSLRFEFHIPQNYLFNYTDHAIIMTVVMFVIYYFSNLYNSLWRYASIDELVYVVLASFAGSSLLFILFSILQIALPRSFYILFLLLNITFVGGTRFAYRFIRRVKSFYLKEDTDKKRVLIIGGGKAGSMVIKEMHNNPQIQKQPIGVIDDDLSKYKRKIHGVPVVGTRKNIKSVIQEKRIDEIIIAMPSADKGAIKEIAHMCKDAKCKLKTLPGVYELIDGKVDIKKIRDVEIADLLGREPIQINLEEICGYLQDEVVLITGGGGSIGSELCRQIARFQPKKLLILDIYENNAYDIQNELLRRHKDLDLEVLIASIRDQKRMEQIFQLHNPTVVFHAAAHKHVPLMEANPTEAIKNNIFGTLNMVNLANKYSAKRFVLISTDKAVNPTNIMGATKRVAEMIIQAMDKYSQTEYVAVRFGNVLGSNGSVIPLFKKQIAEGGPVTVTHPDIIRYFMTIPEAVQLVIQAGAMAEGGEIFVLDMGAPVKIVDLARDLIKLSGFEPDVDIEIAFTGLRPGEKLYEELLMAEEGLTNTKHEKIFIGQPLAIDMIQLKKELSVLSSILEIEEKELIEPIIKKLVPTYRKVG
ncbi:nucleoside-diphosphate sugar epimerase/dehydratase [Clostridiaceae bacterium 35-E11]